MRRKDYLSTREAAEALGVAVSTVQLWANNGLLKAWRTGGGHRRITRESVEAMLNHRQADLGAASTDAAFSVVIVEDDEQQMRLYSQHVQLHHGGARVITACDGYEGLIKIGLHQPDVIITDLVMPNINGFQMIRLFKDMPELAHCVILVVTGLERAEVERRGGLPEGVHLFFKPVDLAELQPFLHKQPGVGVA